MNFDWQTAAVVLVIALAGVYLARRAWQTVVRKKTAACGACPACPANPEQAEPQVIGVAQLTQAASHAGERDSGENHNGAPRE